MKSAEADLQSILYWGKNQNKIWKESENFFKDRMKLSIMKFKNV